MNTPQNASPNYDAILQSIQQEIQGLKTKLLLKETRFELLATQLKETQTELEANQRELRTTQSGLQTTQSDLNNTQTKVRSTQSELRSVQKKSNSTQSELRNTQSELKDTQSQLRNTQTKLKSTQSELRNTQSQLKATQSELGTTEQKLKASSQYVDKLLVGSIAAFAMPSPPQGWLECKGQAVSRTRFPRLFERIGTTFGIGNGSTTFNLPDLRGVFVRGWDKSGRHDSKRAFGSYQVDQMQSHTHKDSGHSHRGNVSSEGSHSHAGKSDNAGSHSHSGRTKDRRKKHEYYMISMRDKYLTKTNNGEIKHINYFDDFTRENEIHEIRENVFKYLLPKNSYQLLIKMHMSSLDLLINKARNHSHSLYIDSAGLHSHALSIKTSRASLGEPTASGAGIVRHGSETRPKNVALLFCIKY